MEKFKQLRQRENYTFEKFEIDVIEKENLKLLTRMVTMQETGFSRLSGAAVKGNEVLLPQGRSAALC